LNSKNESHLPHVTNGKCWCKEVVPVMVDGQKVGTATIDHTGMMTASISSEVLAKKFTEGITESLSISTKLKAPEVSVVQTLNRF
jgi:hypothetical protein